MEGSTAITFADFSSILSAITGQFSVETIVGVLAGVIGLGIAFVFLWWGVRLGISKLMGAIRKGRI